MKFEDRQVPSICHIGQTVQNISYSPFPISPPASTCPCPHTSAVLGTTQGSFFNQKSGHVTCLPKTVQGLLMPHHGQKPQRITHLTFPTRLPSLCSKPVLPSLSRGRALAPYRLPLSPPLSCRYLHGQLPRFLHSLAPESPPWEAFPGHTIKNHSLSPFLPKCMLFSTFLTYLLVTYLSC